MAFQFSDDVRSASLDAIETAIGVSPTLELRSGAKPATCVAADSGTVLATMVLPANWMADAAAGTKALAGVWQDLSADAAGTVGHFRVKAGANCKMQGTVTATGGGGDMTLDNPVLAVAQAVSISGFTLTAGGA